MINLYMDDVRECPFIGWITCRTVAETKRWLETGLVNHMSLDHDMGACEDCRKAKLDIGDFTSEDQMFVSWCRHEEDGEKLVQWMIETGHWSKVKPTVHSANPVGAHRMRMAIERYWPGDYAENSRRDPESL